MIVAFTLALYATVASVALPFAIAGKEWAHRAPRLAITLWHAACASVIGSVLLSALALAVPAAVIGHDLAALFEACAYLFTPGNGGFTERGIRTWFAALLVTLLLARITYCTTAVLVRSRRERHRHAEMLMLLGRQDVDLGAVVVEHGQPIVYCLPGRQGRAVITTGALLSLTPEQVAAVLSHEQAHLRGKHHLILAVVDSLARAFPAVPLFIRAKTEVARLVELLADDIAAEHHPRIHIATALVEIASARVPSFTLGAGGETALTRVQRMLRPAAPLALRERLAGTAAVALLIAGPATVALFPSLSSFLAHHCHRLFPL